MRNTNLMSIMIYVKLTESKAIIIVTVYYMDVFVCARANTHTRCYKIP